MEARYTIGTQFWTRGKYPRLCTVTDILKTYNAQGELVKIRYVAEHELMGKMIADYDVCDTTIAMGRAELEWNHEA